MIGERDNLLLLCFIRDLRAAEDDRDVRAQLFEHGDDLGGLRDIPNIHAEAHNSRFLPKQGLHDLQRLLVDDEFEQAGTLQRPPEVGHEVAEPERGVDVFRVERGEDDVRHVRAPFWPKRGCFKPAEALYHEIWRGRGNPCDVFVTKRVVQGFDRPEARRS